MRFIPLLLLSLLSCFLLSHQESISSKEASNYAFTPTGTLWIATSYSHLAIPLSISTLKRKIDILEKAVRSLMQAQRDNPDVNLRSATLKAQEDLYFCKSGYESIKYFIKPPSPAKQKRFLGGFIGGLISSSLFGIFNAVKLAALQKAVNGAEDARLHMVHSIEQIANNSAINSQHIKHLENMSKLIANEVSKNRLGLDVGMY